MFSGEFSFSLGDVNIQACQHFVHTFGVSFHAGVTELDDWVHDELDETSFHLGSVFSCAFNLPFFGFGIEVVVSPQFFHHFVHIGVEFCCVESSESGDGESPAFFSGSEGD